jgi:glycerophosphoryl diester phosphodiesterase
MKIVAHRGYSARYAENSALAYERAIAAGADYIETDVRMSADGELICWHDPDLQRVAGVEAKIAETPYTRLRAIELPGGACVLRLGDVLSIARNRVRVLLDVKIDSAACARAVIEAVGAANMTSQSVYGARSASSARRLLAAQASFDRLAMPSKPENLDDFPHAGLIGVRLWEEQIDDAALARIRARGLAVWVTAGLRDRGETAGTITAERLRRLRLSAVDAVLVNDVELAVHTRR